MSTEFGFDFDWDANAARIEDGGVPHVVSKQDFANLAHNNPERLFIVSMASRPGSTKFVTTLEYEHFAPTSKLGIELHMYICKWEDMFWYVISIPAKRKDIVDEVLKETCMRMADGLPTMLGGPNGESRFPIQSPNAFTLENDWSKRSPLDIKKEDEMAEVDDTLKDYSKRSAELN